MILSRYFGKSVILREISMILRNFHDFNICCFGVFCVFCRIKLSYCILNEWYLTVLPSFSMKWRYIDIEPVLNFIPIKLHRVFLSYNVVTVSSHYLIFYQHMYARQLSNRSIFHAGRYLDDKEICYLGTVIVTANVCRGRL